MNNPTQLVRDILTQPGWKQERIASELGVAQSSVHRWLMGAEPRGNIRDAIIELHARVVGDDEQPERTVRLAGYVGAAQEIYQFDEDGAGHVEAPPGAGKDTEAVEVRGESMLPLYEDGTILYYSKLLAPEEMIGKRCVVRLADERMLVKTLRRGSGPGVWSLLSLNAPEIEDVVVEWAAPIDWIKPR